MDGSLLVHPSHITIPKLLFLSFLKMRKENDVMAHKDLITGQIVLRDSIDKIPGVEGDDRKVMMVVGVIAVPKDTPLKGECKYTICSKPKRHGIMGLYELIDPDMEKLNRLVPEFEEIEIALLPETEEDISDEIRGDTIGGALTSHHRWRV